MPRALQPIWACARHDAPGRVFPVETRYLDKAQRQTISADAMRAVHRALTETDKSILVFLPGEAEIRRTEDLLNSSGLPKGTVVRPLYGAMSFAEQDAAIRPSPAGERKIVLATTIAETSLTIDGIGAVIDTGFKRVPRFDPASGMTALEQCGVIGTADGGPRRPPGPGIGYRLWPEAETRALKPHDEPEIFVADLAAGAGTQRLGSNRCIRAAVARSAAGTFRAGAGSAAAVGGG
jgi:ATP-dependent helicase HrpB